MAQRFLLMSVRDGRVCHHVRCPQHTSTTGHNSAWRLIISASPGHWANVAKPANVQDHAGHRGDVSIVDGRVPDTMASGIISRYQVRKAAGRAAVGASPDTRPPIPRSSATALLGRSIRTATFRIWPERTTAPAGPFPRRAVSG